MKQKLLIFPFNGNAIEAIDCLGDKFELLGFVDDTAEKLGMSFTGFEVFDRSAFEKFRDAKVLAVPGSPASFKIRHEIIGKLGLEDDRYATVIHPKAIVSRLATVGKNVLLMAGVVITSNAVIGDHVCILPNSVVHHDSRIDAYSLIGAGVQVAGHVVVGRNCYIGSGSAIINNIEIGEYTLVGLGSRVIRTLPANAKAVGSPARLL